ncbi:MAG: hypothetical protein LBP54_03140 [Campylobacteraceae bacterium]|jgi:hypothetical protein|nr:hypothetical protein [Campylobacteraceae bacterium]
MKTLLFIILVLSLPLSCIRAQEQKSKTADYLNYQNIPVLGWQTKQDAALAHSLNTIAKRWIVNACAIDTKHKYCELKQDERYNEALIKCKEKKYETEYYSCMEANNVDDYHLSWILESMYKDDEKATLDPFPNAKTSKICRQILDKKLFLKDFKNYIVYKDDKNHKMKNLIFTISAGTAHVPSFFYKQLPIDTNETEFLNKIDYFNLDKFEQRIEVYFWIWSETPKIFLLDNNIYLDLVSKNENHHYIFSFDKENYFFDQACKIERKITGYKNKEQICRQVIKGEYKKVVGAPLSSVVDGGQFEHFNADINLTKYFSTYHHEEDNNTYFIDYRNEGKKHILLNLDYSSGAGAGCDYNFLVVYNPNKSDKVYYIGEVGNYDGEYEMFPSVFADCNMRTKEEIISIGKKNYILLSGSGKLVGLYEITASDDGEDIINDICTFELLYSYE